MQQKKKATYKVRNWSEYNKALINRYDITVWIEKGIANVWEEKVEEGKKRKRGGQRKFSKQAIECLATLKELFHLTYRGIQGFGASLFVGILKLAIKIPDYTTIDRRRKGLTVKLPTKDNGTIDIVFDSSGLKVYGEGEWKVRKHGWSKHRTWRKIHLAINPETSEIEAVELTENNKDDGDMVKPMLNQIKQEIDAVAGDGAYDKKKVYEELSGRVNQMNIPPQKNARIWVHGNKKGAKHPRDENLRRIRTVGRQKWKEEISYHKRSLAETGMYRFKTIFDGRLTSRILEQQEKEAQIKCKLLNQMTHLGMPISYCVP
jgi:hypothetical protein